MSSVSQGLGEWEFSPLAGGMMAVTAMGQQVFTPGNLVVTVEGCGVHAGTCTTVPNGNGTGSGNSSVGGYGDNQAGPLTLFQYEPVGTSSVNYVGSFVLPQTANGANLPVSGEYGSSSEGTVQLSGSGKYLTVMGYGVSAAAFNANPFGYTVNASPALGQSGSLTGQAYTPVPRVVALIDSTGAVNSATALTNVFDQNNPRSAYSQDGSSVYVSGQGNSPDQTGGGVLFGCRCGEQRADGDYGRRYDEQYADAGCARCADREWHAAGCRWTRRRARARSGATLERWARWVRCRRRLWAGR